jgi:hypothetical protein
MAFKQQNRTVARHASRSITQVTDDLSGGLLLDHQSHSFACIDIGEIVVLIVWYCDLLLL